MRAGPFQNSNLLTQCQISRKLKWFWKTKKIPKDGDVPKSEPCGVYFLTKSSQRFWVDPQTNVTPDQSPVILFYLRPWQSLRQNSTTPEILEEFLIQWAPKKEKNWRMNARTYFSLFRLFIFWILQQGISKKLSSPKKFIRIFGVVRELSQIMFALRGG